MREMPSTRNAYVGKDGKRRDSKGRVLKKGESERKSDHLYSYRYRDIRGKMKGQKGTILFISMALYM